MVTDDDHHCQQHTANNEHIYVSEKNHHPGHHEDCAASALTIEQKQLLRQYSEEYMKVLHDEVNRIMKQCRGKSNDRPIRIPYWLDGRNEMNGKLNERMIPNDDGTDHRNMIFFNMNGFQKMEQFCPKEECHGMIEQMELLVQYDWNENETLDTFGTDEKENIQRDHYFLQSSYQVHYFTEPHAVIQMTTTTTTTTNENNEDNINNKEVMEETAETQHEENINCSFKMMLKPEFCGRNKIKALNKVGHALHYYPYWEIKHELNDNNVNEKDMINQDCTHTKEEQQQKIPNVFYQYCISNKIRTLLMNDLQYIDPIVPQSMYIFKQSYHGGIVNSHQDSTFLYTTPKQTCIGLWLALHDSTLDNGCLWIRPKSHIDEPTRRHYQQNINRNTMKNESKFIMKELYEYRDQVPWDGSLPTFRQAQIYKQRKQEERQQQGFSSSTSSSHILPTPPVIVPSLSHDDGDDDNDNKLRIIQNLLDCNFIPIECKQGDLLVFCGDIDHLSLHNDSSLSRHTFQLHIVEGDHANIIWSSYNWLQYPPDLRFLRLKDFCP